MIRTTARRLAHLLTGTTYVALGYDAVRTPGGRVDLAAPTLTALRQFLPLPQNDELVVRGNAAVQTLAGAALAAGILPRTSAAVIAGSLVPTTIAGHAFWKVEDPAVRKMQQVQLLKNVALLGGLVAIASERKCPTATS
jgi:uncharacterized membrane protein YphA (DoxX/SURF4 family)